MRPSPVSVLKFRAKLALLTMASVCLTAPGAAQAPGQQPAGAGELQLALNKLSVLGSVLYVSAHPDDENTAFLATMAKGRLYRTGYLSLTRGEGGQNLVGAEQGAALGLIRTQELLAARRIDGAEQYFTRAIDFGYSKSTEETLEFWGRQEILSDIVWVIRSFRPDVIVTRFTPTRGGHGNHTASALLALEAYTAAADSTRFPEQLALVKPWKAKRIVWNVFRFSRSTGESPEGSWVTMDLGAYNPLLGLSYGELAGMSRSMHKSQGFGALEQRGIWTNAFEHLAGDTARTDLFDGVETTWERLKGGEVVAPLLQRAAREFVPSEPARILPLLQEALGLLDAMEADPWIDLKREELTKVILSCSGIWLEAIASQDQAVPGSTVPVGVRVINRSNEAVRLKSLSITPGQADTLLNVEARSNVPVEVTLPMVISPDHPFSQPYWLEEDSLVGRYEVRDRTMIGMPENRPEASARIRLQVRGLPLECTVPVEYRWVDPTLGERTRQFAVVPPVSLAVTEGVVFSVKGSDALTSVLVSPTEATLEGNLSLELPAGWRAEPTHYEIKTDSVLSDRVLAFRLIPGSDPEPGRLRVRMDLAGKLYSQTLHTISYPHIETQEYLEPASSLLQVLDVNTLPMHLGYIMGSGDVLPSLLRRLGYRVDLLSDETLESGDLGVYDAIVAGVRAYNTRAVLRSSRERLMRYVEDGGRYIVQYVNRQNLGSAQIGPYPFAVSNARVSVETAPVTMVRPDHPLLNFPNRIREEDFADWVQERGLYFADAWDGRYETVLASHDPGEGSQEGGLLYARYGRGYFVYTGYAWFRQLPAGVSGAYRLFVNLLSQQTDPRR